MRISISKSEGSKIQGLNCAAKPSRMATSPGFEALAGNCEIATQLKLRPPGVRDLEAEASAGNNEIATQLKLRPPEVRDQEAEASAGKGVLPIGLVVAILLMVAQALWLSVYTVDDAFISFRYARNLIEGNGLVFNPGEHVEGYTNFLWTMLMAGAMRLGVDPILAAKLLGILASVGTLYLVYRLSMVTKSPAASRESREQAKPLHPVPYTLYPSPWYLSLLAVALLAVNGAFATAAITGLETSLFTFFVAAGAYVVVADEFRPNRRETWLNLCPIFFALAALTRPEGLAIFGATIVLKVLSRSFNLHDLRHCARWIVVFGAIYMSFFAWRLWYYGDFLPNTFYAKTGAGLAQFYKGILDLKDFSLTYLGAIFLIALLVLARRRSPFWLTYITGLVITFITLHIYEGGDWIPFYRFLTPALPLYYLVIQEAVRRLWLEARGGSRESRVATFLFYVASIALVALTAWPSIAMHEQLARESKGQEMAHAALGRWLGDNARGPIALMDIGRIGYISRLPILDTSGLTDRTIAHSAGGLIDKRFDLAYALERQPQYFVLTSTTNFVKGGSAPTDFPIERRIFDDERFEQYYRHLFTLDSGWQVGGKGYFLMVYERK